MAITNHQNVSDGKYLSKIETKGKMWKENWSTWHNHGTKKKSESLTGIEPMTSSHWAARTHGEQGNLTAEFILCDRCPAYCLDQHFSESGNMLPVPPTLPDNIPTSNSKFSLS